MFVGQWPTFHGRVTLSYILKTTWWINVVLEILIKCDTNIELNYICRSVTYISCSSDFALYLEDNLMDKCHNWNAGSMWCKDLPDKIYVGQWPTLHGPLILSYILKTIWLINVVLELLIQWDYKYWTETIYVCQGPIFHGPVILPYILKTIWWTNVIVGILDPWDAKLNHIKCMWVSDLHFIVQWLLTYLEDVLMEECWTEDIDSVWH